MKRRNRLIPHGTVARVRHDKKATSISLFRAFGFSGGLAQRRTSGGP